ncbi:MAG: hypothetical protein IPK13_01570 [Deltaproteobacteria bacterium]|nr:hypothetical protein [Deltaproteobacteria bacterium]
MLNALNPNTLGTQINDLLGKYGIQGGMIGAQVDALGGNPLGALKNLQDAFFEAALGKGTTGAQRQFLTGGGLPPFGFCQPPHLALQHNHARCGHTYAQRTDLAPGAASGPFAQLFDPRRRAAAQFERALTNNPLIRSAFERAVGGKFIPDGRADGKVTIQRHHHHHRPHHCLPGMNPLANTAASLLKQMDAAIANQLGGLANALSPFQGLLASGLQNAFGQLAPQCGTGGANGANGANGSEGASGSEGSDNEIAKIFSDPSLTVEDKITAMLMAVMKKMDKEIEEQGKKIEKLQNNGTKDQGTGQAGGQGGKGGKGGGGKLGAIGGIAGSIFGGPIGGALGSSVGQSVGGMLGGQGANGAGAGANGAAAGADGSSKSVDVETTKLKRLTDKRSQMFDLLRQIIDGYNKTAKGIIDSIGR